VDATRVNQMINELTGQAVGGWQIAKYINAGQSAAVFKGTNGSREGAVKIFDSALVEKFGKQVQLARVNRELSLIGKDHPNLVRIFDGGECAKTGRLFIVMEFIEAPSMATVIADVPRDRIWPMISQIASAAQYLEGLNLVHRDIKPDNIVVERNFERAILLDLGVIKPIENEVGITDHSGKQPFIGTLRYSSPEFLVREEEDTIQGWRALTFYQLGAVLHDMIMRYRLFKDYEEPYARLAEAVKHEAPLVSAADIPPDLLVLARTCLLKDPKLRFELVSWENFHLPTKTASNPVLDAKERIRKRAWHTKQPVAPNDVEIQAELRRIRQVVGGIQGQIQELIREECIGSDLFPPIEVHEKQTAEEGKGELIARFCKSHEHGLVQNLQIWFIIKLLEKDSRTIRLSVAVAACLVFPEDIPLEVFPQVAFEGAFERAAVKSRVQDVIYRAFDQAQEMLICDQGPCWISLFEAEKNSGV